MGLESGGPRNHLLLLGTGAGAGGGGGGGFLVRHCVPLRLPRKEASPNLPHKGDQIELVLGILGDRLNQLLLYGRASGMDRVRRAVVDTVLAQIYNFVR